MIFTQLDKFLDRIRVKLTCKLPNVSTEDIELLVEAEFKRKLEDDFIKPLRLITKNDKYPHAVVSSRVSLTCQSSVLTSNFQHVRLTENLSGVSSRLSSNFSKTDLG
jgi:hypothetical protein